VRSTKVVAIACSTTILAGCSLSQYGQEETRAPDPFERIRSLDLLPRPSPASGQRSATVAKVMLGDIMGVGYTIDPRVHGTISLASSPPIARSDILYVFENTLRASNAAFTHDAGDIASFRSAM
jgi:hypothetical protein